MAVDLRPLHEWVTLWAAEHDIDAVDLEARAIAHLEDLGELDGIERGTTHRWLVTRASADRLLTGLAQTGEHDRL
ncbi:hypothetical protein [Xylanimonas protaetiae]|uniref:Uncharacterized protein n=1 Tax=Xylanimonas protaetiae TaxID=2509457 RepID=A0A4V0YG49_9MICO|nr:hypothetical protein [Xylanimonas protaetiae]QAY69971.1 hypothetical protein ET471_07945 [Xylanimonas protaetiae]